MKNRLALQSYIILTFIVVSVVITIIVALASFYLLEKSEKILIKNTLQQEAEVLADYYANNPGKKYENNDHIRIYIVGPDRKDNLPAGINNQSVNMDVMLIHGVEYVFIRKIKSPYNIYFLFNFSDYEKFERDAGVIFAAYILISAVIGLITGIYASRKILNPVRRLAESLEQGSDRYAPTEIPRDYINDDVGFLANKMADYNDTLRSYIEREKTFTSNVSHEIRTPLSVISGAIELLDASTSLSDADRVLIARIRDEIASMKELVNIMLEIARGETRQQVKIQFDVNTLIQEILDRLSGQAKEKNINLKCIENTKFSITGNRLALDIVLRNLVMNSIQHTSISGTIAISIHNNEIIVHDDGPGVPDDIQEKIFERFIREKNESVTENLGVGLALVKQLCQVNNWTISMQSGKTGTTITLLL